MVAAEGEALIVTVLPAVGAVAGTAVSETFCVAVAPAVTDTEAVELLYPAAEAVTDIFPVGTLLRR